MGIDPVTEYRGGVPEADACLNWYLSAPFRWRTRFAWELRAGKPCVALFDVDNFVLTRTGNALALEELAAELRKEGYEIEVRRNEFPFVHMRKNTTRALQLRLRPFEPSFPLFEDERENLRK